MRQQRRSIVRDAVIATSVTEARTLSFMIDHVGTGAVRETDIVRLEAVLPVFG